MILYIVRHGKAEDAGAYRRDEDRPLTARGIEQARFLGRQISVGPGSPELIVSSAFSRAVATARLIHQAVRCRFELSEVLECDHPASEAVALIESHAGVESLMVVGHNPQLGELTTILSRGPAGAEVMLRTGEAVCMQVDPDDLIGTGRIVERMRYEGACVG